MTENAKFVNYSTLQQLIDKLISRYGTEKTCNILKKTLQEKNPSFNQDYVIANIIANTAIEQFKISAKQFKSDKKGTAYYARASCFRLIKIYTQLSYTDILHFFNEKLTVEKVRYAIQTANDTITLPNVNRGMYDNFTNHEKKVAETIKIIP